MLNRVFVAACLIGTLAACGDDGSSGTINLVMPSAAATEFTDYTVTAQRTGGSSGSVTVTYSTQEGTATPDVDYTVATGTVTWEDGDSEDKTFTIPILEDFLIEQPESFIVSIDNATGGASIGTDSGEATIADDDHVGDSIAVSSDGTLYTFDKASPNRFTFAVELTGLGSETIVGVDARPADGKFYALTSSGKLYTIDRTTGVATMGATLAADPADTSTPFTGLTGTDIGMDFNPVVDRLRVTSSTGQNLRINVDTGLVTTDTAINGLATGYGAVAYNNSVAPACRTTLYAIDVSTNRFLQQNPPNDGLANGVGGLGIDPTASGGFDVGTDAAGVSTGLALLTVEGKIGFYTIELTSGAATSTGAMYVPDGESILGFAVATVPATTPVTQLAGELYGATATGLISFNRAATDKLCGSHAFNGLAVGEIPVAIDVRPSTGVLYVLTKTGTAGKLHRVDPASGNLSPAIPISVPLQGTEFGMDFNPTGVVALRIVSNTGQNIRVTDLVTGTASADAGLNGTSTAATGAAYTDSVQGAGATTLYVIDATTDTLAIQSPPNAGTTVAVGALGIDVSDTAGFDIDGRDNSAVIAVTTGASTALHSINLATGAVTPTPLGVIGGGAPLIGIARVTPTTNVFGLTTDNKLFRLSLADPTMVTPVGDPMVSMPVDGTITGLAAGENLIGIDVRPGSNIIYAIGSNGNVYTVNSSTATANNLGPLVADPMDTSAPFSSLSGTSFGYDFNPTGPVALRVISNTEQNLRIPNVSTPTAFTDTVVTPAGEVTAAAYSNSFVPPAGTTLTTTLYVIDVATGQLMSAANPNNGALTPVGPLAAGTIFSDGTPSPSGFDIAGGNNGIALAALQLPTATPGTLEASSRLYRIDLVTGAATAIGTVGGTPLRGLAIQIR